MRVQIERTFLTTARGTRVIEVRPDVHLVEADSLQHAILNFIRDDGARLLGTMTDKGERVVATAWKGRVYLLCAEAAPD